MPIRILIVDDHSGVRRGLALVLRAFDDLHLVGEAADGQEAVRLCAQLGPDVVLMDLLMPGMDGVAATRAVRLQHPSIQVVAITTAAEASLRAAALDAGAAACIGKHVSIDELAAAIRAAYRPLAVDSHDDQPAR